MHRSAGICSRHHIALLWCAGLTSYAPAQTYTFDRSSDLPPNWRAQGTNQQGDVASWAIRETRSAASGPNVLALVDPKIGFAGTYNLFWTDTHAFLDGSIEARVRAVTGGLDQGGGIAWRIRDAQNYYVCRANPLENNLRLYAVTNGRRKLLDTETADLPIATWHSIKVEQKANEITCSLNGVKLLRSTDSSLSEPGGVGFWAKADAVSYFDDLTIEPSDPAVIESNAPAYDARVTKLHKSARVSLAEAIALVEKQTRGKAVEAHYEADGDRLLVVVCVIVADAARFFHVDARSARVIAIDDQAR